MEVGVVGLLRTAWIAATLPILIAALPFSWLSSFRGAVLGFAKRGKTMQSSSQVTDLSFWREFDGLFWFMVFLVGEKVEENGKQGFICSIVMGF